MDTARVRKTFEYPEDDAQSTTSRDELDEEEQEHLISSLQAQSRNTNAIYATVFTLLPLACVPLYLYHLIFNSVIPGRLRVLSLLSITSLLVSSFMMFFMSNIDNTDARTRLNARQRQVHRSTFQQPQAASLATRAKEAFTQLMDKLDDLRMNLDADGPLIQSLPFLNGIMCFLLAIAAWPLSTREVKGVPDFMWLYLLVPTVMLLVTAAARLSIRNEQQGLQELRGLRYDYKGA